MNCRHCQKLLEHKFLDLGFAPPSNAYLVSADLNRPETYFPLRLFVCQYCWLVQTEDFPQAQELFRDDYAYFSSVSNSWLAHAARYVEMIITRLALSRDSLVLEIAANDGYLLRNFIAAGIPCLGVEPTANTAAAAEALGIPVRREFFNRALGEKLAAEGKQADLIVGNNVFAHVPDINDFTQGLKAALKPGGTLTLEFPHLMRLIEHTQFDTVYHEHFSYFSLQTVCRIFSENGLRVLDVEELPTHGGSIRVYGCQEDDPRGEKPSVKALLDEEERQGLFQLATYLNFQTRTNRIKDDLLIYLIDLKRAGRSVAGYGAAAKGNTLLNYSGVKSDLLPYVCDAAPSKQGKFLPGSHIPVVSPDQLRKRQPEYILILPWNLSIEVIAQQTCVKQWGGRFIVGVPKLREII